MFTRFLAATLLLALAACQSTADKTATTTPAASTGTDSTLAAMMAAVRQYPDSALLADALIDTLTNRGEYASAAAWCDTLLRRPGPDHSIYLLVKADLLRSGKQYAAAQAAYRSYIALQPAEPTLYLSLANTMAEAGDTATLPFADSVWQAFRTPQVRTGLAFIRGIYYSSRQQYAQARRWFDSTIVYDYAFAEAHLEKGYAWYDEGNYSEAVRSFETLTDIDTKNADAWYWLGKSREAADDKAGAIKAYQRSLLLNPAIAEAQAALDRLQ
ncbi:MAG: tetratricopeptide repeat protein [Chitinophagaceae bacterium]|jgi:tetratricopeptide (TPR) repeat protein|nr:tetratricopeptide repeat protein [Chitinophagaceae bacterium]